MWKFRLNAPTQRKSLIRTCGRLCLGAKKFAIEELLPGLPSDLVPRVSAELDDYDSQSDIILVRSKEGPHAITGVSLLHSESPMQLRTLTPASVDLVVEPVATEMTMAGGTVAWQCHFYPHGGHEFSLAQSFILNLASVAKILRVGGKFVFRTLAETDEDILPFAFVNLRHLLWDVQVVRGSMSGEIRPLSIVICTLLLGAHEVLAANTPAVLEEECFGEESRKRYFDVLRPMVQDVRAIPSTKSATTPLTILDVGGGDGSLAAWFFSPEFLSCDGPCHLTLMEENAELAERASKRLLVEHGVPQKQNICFDASSSVDIVAHGSGTWPFADGQFNIVILAFMLHHVRPLDRHEVLQEACRVANNCVLVLEDQPSNATSQNAQKLSWLVTEEHFRPFGQDPADYVEHVLSDCSWRELFASCGLAVKEVTPFSGTLRHPVPHIAYRLVPLL